MEIYASQRYTRQAPRKVRLVANTVKSLSLEAAFRQLATMERAASLPVMKTLRQAVANAQHNHNLSPTMLKIKSIVVENGPIYKRYRAVSRGRGHSIQKKTAHIVVRLETIENTAPVTAAAEKKTESKAEIKPEVKTEAKAVVKKTTAATKKAKLQGKKDKK